ncbi:MAG: HDOD domain-containing protein [Candidatus Anammoxibacter sp.]
MVFHSELLDMVEKMPAFPQSVNRVIELSSDINSSHKDLVAVIEHDPVMTLKVLKLINSPYFGLAREVTSVNYAVVYVGLNTVKNLAISIASIGMLPRDNDAGLNIDQFLYHAISTAALAKVLAKHMSVPDIEASDYFVSGLLHDFGKIVFAQFMPEEFKKVLSLQRQFAKCSVDAEKEVIGADHAHVGKLLGEKWSLAPAVIEGITLHHSNSIEKNNNVKNKLLVNIISVANKLSTELAAAVTIESFSEELIADAASRFDGKLDECLEGTVTLKEEVEKSMQCMRV